MTNNNDKKTIYSEIYKSSIKRLYIESIKNEALLSYGLISAKIYNNNLVEER